MFGALRFFLAVIVVVEHLGASLHIPGVAREFNQGIFAVVLFYILSGYIMAYFFKNVFGNLLSNSLSFYQDRIFRIFPQFLFFAFLTIVFLLLTKFGNPKFELKTLFLNLLVVPLNYYMYLDLTILRDPVALQRWTLVPPGWSLGVELQYYALVPFLFFVRKARLFISVISLTVFTLVSLLYSHHAENLCFRLLPGVLFIFLSGAFIFYINNSEDKKTVRTDLIYLCMIYCISCLMLVVLKLNSTIEEGFLLETLSGLVIGIPLISFLSGIKIKSSIDDFLGHLSYGIYLGHTLVIWFFQFLVLHVNFMKSWHGLFAPMVLIVSIFLSYVSYSLTDLPIGKFRRKLRSR